MENRDEILKLDDSALSARCEFGFTRGSGNGGQKRNKTSSAVRVSLPGTGYVAEDCSERSQYRNRAAALRKLRLEIALAERISPAAPPERSECALDHPDYPLWLAHLLDVLEQSRYDLKVAAVLLGISPTACLKKLARDPRLWQFAQTRRECGGLPPLRHP